MMLDALTNVVASGFGAGISFLSGYIALSWTRLHKPDSTRTLVKVGFAVALIVTGWFVVQGIFLDFISNARIVGFTESFFTSVNKGNIIFFFACLPVDGLFIQAFRTKSTGLAVKKDEPKVSKTKPLRHDTAPVQTNMKTRTLAPVPEAQYKVSPVEINPFEPLPERPTKTKTEGKQTDESPTVPSSVASSLGNLGNILEDCTPVIVGMTKGNQPITVYVHNSVLNGEAPPASPQPEPEPEPVETVQTPEPVCTEEKLKKKGAPNSALVSHCHK